MGAIWVAVCTLAASVQLNDILVVDAPFGTAPPLHTIVYKILAGV